MAEQQSALYAGHVMHHRMYPVKHRFIYRVFSCCLDLDELPQLNRLKLFSVNRFNLFSFHEKDHGLSDGQLAQQIRDLLTARGYQRATHRIKLLCYPRILGYAFNPLSVYFCYAADGQLAVILYEVSNTFGSRHTYLLEADPQADIIRHGCHKQMYVSPFMPMATAYHFRIKPPAEQIAVCIRQTERLSEPETGESHSSTATPILHATFSGQHTTLNDRTLIKMFLKYPLMTLKVIGGIHWEALKLWRKKLSIQPREKTITSTISWQDKTGAQHYESL